jgi:hypothetical protein
VEVVVEALKRKRLLSGEMLARALVKRMPAIEDRELWACETICQNESKPDGNDADMSAWNDGHVVN